MFIAHLGVGLAAKKAAPRVSLGVLLIACQLVDILCGLFIVIGLEHMRVTPGITRMTPLEFVSFPWSHGLFMSVVWSALAALVAFRLYKEPRAAFVVGALVFSHWVLDWISHIPDLPLLFDGSPKVGLGLWNSPAGTMAAEFGLFGAGAVLYLRSTVALDRKGRWTIAALLLFFPGLFLLNHYGPPPPLDIPEQILAMPIFVFIVLLPWGAWIERHRALRPSVAPTG